MQSIWGPYNQKIPSLMLIFIFYIAICSQALRISENHTEKCKSKLINE